MLCLLICIHIYIHIYIYIYLICSNIVSSVCTKQLERALKKIAICCNRKLGATHLLITEVTDLSRIWAERSAHRLCHPSATPSLESANAGEVAAKMYCECAIPHGLANAKQLSRVVARSSNHSKMTHITIIIVLCRLTYKNILSPPSRSTFTTDGKANHSGISSPERRRLRKSVPESLAIFTPFFFASGSVA